MLIPTSQNVKTVTDMREDAVKLLDQVNKLGTIYIFQHSAPKAVLLSMEEYTRLQELMEDRLDEIEAKELSGEDRGEGIPLERVLKKYTK